MSAIVCSFHLLFWPFQSLLADLPWVCYLSGFESSQLEFLLQMVLYYIPDFGLACYDQLWMSVVKFFSYIKFSSTISLPSQFSCPYPSSLKCPGIPIFAFHSCLWWGRLVGTHSDAYLSFVFRSRAFAWVHFGLQSRPFHQAPNSFRFHFHCI